MQPDEHQTDDQTLAPTTDTTAISQRPEPGKTGEAIPVPKDLAQAGHDTNEPRDDSPESLDEELAQGANREDIDPDHSITRPAVDSIDKEENGAN